VVDNQASTIWHHTIEVADGDKETHEKGGNNTAPYRIDIDDEAEEEDEESAEDELCEFITESN
jgi:hypothetical protein